METEHRTGNGRTAEWTAVITEMVMTDCLTGKKLRCSCVFLSVSIVDTEVQI